MPKRNITRYLWYLAVVYWSFGFSQPLLQKIIFQEFIIRTHLLRIRFAEQQQSSERFRITTVYLNRVLWLLGFIYLLDCRRHVTMLRGLDHLLWVHTRRTFPSVFRVIFVSIVTGFCNIWQSYIVPYVNIRLAICTLFSTYSRSSFSI